MLPLTRAEALSAARQERKRRRKLTRHIYTDAELREIMDQTWIQGEGYGAIRGNPEFVAKYVNDPILTPEEKAALLARRVAVNLIQRLNTQPGICSLIIERSTLDPSKWVMVFTWLGKEPSLPPILYPHPLIAFKQVFSHPMDFKLEAEPATVVQSGEPLFQISSTADSEQTPFGTLGSILTIERDNKFIHAGITVGHVVGDFGRSVRMGPLGGNGQLMLSTLPGCERYLGKPGFRAKWPLPRPCLDEICLLDIPTCPSTVNLKCVRPNLDCRQISALSPSIEQDVGEGVASPGTPTLKDVTELQRWVKRQGYLEVFKDGAKTGTTSGRLIAVEEIAYGERQLSVTALSHVSSSSSSSSSSEVDQDDTTVYLLRVKWLSPSQPFAEDGDSGSLVYAKVNGHIIPLGIHAGSNGDLSTAYLLHSWWEEFEFLIDADIYFCDPSRCSPSPLEAP